MGNDTPHLISGRQIARYLGLSSGMIRYLKRKYPDFPKPELRVGRSDAYEIEKVRRWAEAHNRTWDLVRLGDIPPGDTAAKIATVPLDPAPAAGRRNTADVDHGASTTST